MWLSTNLHSASHIGKENDCESLRFAENEIAQSLPILRGILKIRICIDSTGADLFIFWKLYSIKV